MAGLSGISITAGQVNVDYLSTGGFALSGTKLVMGVSTGLNRTTGGTYVDQSSAFYWTGLHNFTDISVDSVQLSAAVSAINQAIDGIGANVTAARLNSVHSDGKLSGSTGFHYHGVDAGSYAIEASAASNVQNVSHNLGAVPRWLEIEATMAANYAWNHGISAGGRTPTFLGQSELASNSAYGTPAGSGAFLFDVITAAGADVACTIVSATSGSFYFSFTKGGSPTGTIYLQYKLGA